MLAGTARKKPIIIKFTIAEEPEEIKTLEGTMTANVGDYIITGVNGEKYPCKPDIFVKSYEVIEATSSNCETSQSLA